MSIEERRYDHLWGQLVFHQAGTRSAFNFYVQLASAIVGGSIWLSLQPQLTRYAAGRFATLSTLLLAGIAVLTCVKIYSHARGWWRLRSFLATIHRSNVPPLADDGPRPRSHLYDAALASAVALSVVAFYVFNPFTIAQSSITAKRAGLTAAQPTDRGGKHGMP